MNFFDLILDFKNGKITEDNFKIKWKQYNDKQFDTVKSKVLGETEDELGVKITDIKGKIKELEAKSKLAEGLPKLQAGFQKQIDEANKEVERMQNEMLKQKQDTDSKYSEILDGYKTKVSSLQAEINKGKLEKMLKDVARELNISPDKVDYFVDDVILHNIAVMKQDKDDFTPATTEFEFEDDNKVKQKSAFVGDKFKDGIVKYYNTDKRLQEFYPKTEFSKGGSGALGGKGNSLSSGEVDSQKFYEEVLSKKGA